MVEKEAGAKLSLAELEVLTEQELEKIIETSPVSADDARYTLGKL
jgi:TPR repeat protein